MKSSSFWLFLIGLGSQTQFHFIGSLGISELPMYLLAPIFFVQDYALLKRDGFMPFIWLSISVVVGCCIASIMNHTTLIMFVKGLATPYSVFAIAVCFHRLLRKNLDGLKWVLIGVFLSSIICIFVFQPETYTSIGGEKRTGEEGVELMISHPLFWTGKISALTTLPVTAAYLSTPIMYSATVPIINAFLKVVFSMTSGRAAGLVSVVSALFILCGRKSRSAMRSFNKKLPVILLVCSVAMAMFKSAYSYAAMNGMLGYEAQKKYLKQTSQGASAWRMLVSGRMEFFVGMMAAVDKPIVGYGPKAEDVKGYYEQFLRDYGAQEDYEEYMRNLAASMKEGLVYRVIPTHSHIMCSWVEDGIFGLAFWLYVLMIIYKCLRVYSSSIPQWFGYFCCVLPALVWDIFFSPFGSRVGTTLALVCVLLAKAVHERRIDLPIEMEMKARQHD